MRRRPKCSRCGGPLDFDHLGGWNADKIEWSCNNPRPCMSDDEFWKRWDELDGDDVVKLTRYHEIADTEQEQEKLVRKHTCSEYE